MKIDDREPEHLKHKDWGFDAEIERLPVGDYIFGDSVGIERKEINDFVGSIEGRLWEQAINMEENFEVPVIIVHGVVSDLSHQNMEPRKINAIYGAITRLTVSYGVSVLWVREESQFVKLVKKYESKAGTKKDREKPHIEKRNFRDDRVNVLCGIYGVGYQTAKNLLDELDSVAGVVNASKDELARADGVGAATAKKIYEICHDGEQEEGLLNP